MSTYLVDPSVIHDDIVVVLIFLLVVSSLMYKIVLIISPLAMLNVLYEKVATNTIYVMFFLILLKFYEI